MTAVRKVSSAKVYTKDKSRNKKRRKGHIVMVKTGAYYREKQDG
jgi:hypothetical protein